MDKVQYIKEIEKKLYKGKIKFIVFDKLTYQVNNSLYYFIDSVWI